jgi:hypothetical protein
MDASVRRQVRQRAGDRCEYCLLRQEDDPFYPFHIEHILPRQHGGPDHPDNLALACYHCNRHKGPNLAAIDPETEAIARLFNPRQDRWAEHFRAVGAVIAGITPVGRATSRLFKMNAAARLDLRTELLARRRWP